MMESTKIALVIALARSAVPAAMPARTHCSVSGSHVRAKNREKSNKNAIFRASHFPFTSPLQARFQHHIVSLDR